MFSFVFVVMASAIPMLEARPFAKTVVDSTKARFGPLTFKPDGTFQIAIFEDLHFGENAWDQWGPQQDINSVKVINEILDAESPGLVVLNGDLITGENTFLENSTTYVDQIVTPLVNRGLTWASTYGNHDHQYNISGSSILAREKLWPNSRTQQMVNTENSGVSNYYLPVYDSRCSHDGCVPELLLWFFDSKGGFKYQEKNSTGALIGNPDWVDSTVVDWFLKKNTELVKRLHKQIPSLAFVHIPTYASYVLQQKGIDAHLQPGINDDNPLAPQGQGWCSDGRNDGSCDYGGNDIPFMQAISSIPELIAVFSGHDHGDSWCDRWDEQLSGMTVVPKNNVILCFSQHTGYGGYGNWERGSRQILVSKSKLKESAVDTWIRLESKNVVGRVTLNSTFGHDQYPATNDTQTYCPTCDYSA
ncbi:Metallo-dependent phosphatase [Rostrohypoxylon terebratum]|nr:Metallo-dependent phosphatase [Rostrohypoxylon terebratum]